MLPTYHLLGEPETTTIEAKSRMSGAPDMKRVQPRRPEIFFSNQSMRSMLRGGFPTPEHLAWILTFVIFSKELPFLKHHLKIFLSIIRQISRV